MVKRRRNRSAPNVARAASRWRGHAFGALSAPAIKNRGGHHVAQNKKPAEAGHCSHDPTLANYRIHEPGGIEVRIARSECWYQCLRYGSPLILVSDVFTDSLGNGNEVLAGHDALQVCAKSHKWRNVNYMITLRICYYPPR